MKYQDFIEIENPIILARNMPDEGEHDELLHRLEKYECDFRRNGSVVCLPEKFYKFAKKALDIFGRIVNKSPCEEVDALARTMVSKFPQPTSDQMNLFTVDKFYKDICGLSIYKTKNGAYTSRQIPGQCNKWIEIACRNDNDYNQNPRILFPEYLEYYNSLSMYEKSILEAHDLIFGGDWDKTRSAFGKKGKNAIDKISEYEAKHDTKLGVYALQQLLGDKNGKRK